MRNIIPILFVAATLLAGCHKKRYDQNFKLSAVEHWLGSGKSANQVAIICFW